MYGTFDWSSYHLHENDYLTHQDVSDHMDEETGVFDWDTYQATQLALLTPTTEAEQDYVRIQWFKPGYIDAISYRIEIQAADETWHVDDMCDG